MRSNGRAFKARPRHFGVLRVARSNVKVLDTTSLSCADDIGIGQVVAVFNNVALSQKMPRLSLPPEDLERFEGGSYPLGMPLRYTVGIANLNDVFGPMTRSPAEHPIK